MSKTNRTYCCVPQCKSLGSRDPCVSFHNFPSEVPRKQEWIRILKIGKEVSKRMKVCSKHFQKTDYFPKSLMDKERMYRRLKKNSVPSLCLPVLSTDSLEQKEKKRMITEKSKQRYDIINEKKLAYLQTQPIDESQSTSSVNEECSTCSRMETDSFEVGDPTMTAVEALLQLANSAEIEIGHAIKFTEEKGTQVTSGDFENKVLINVNKLTEKQLNSLTGIGKKQLFQTLVELAEQELIGYPKRQLHVAERILLTMMKVKLNLSFVVLAVLFGNTSTTCKTIVAETVKILSSILQATLEWPSKEEILNNIPKCFKKHSSVRAVLDCTEIPIERPKCLKCQIMTYSTYKKGHTAKYMLCLTPGGVITFVSRGYGGRASDRQIFQQSAVLDMLDPCVDSVMVDKGFLIEDLCTEKLIELVRPPFLHKGNTQLSVKDANKTRGVAAARIHIERAIQRIKIFKFLHVGLVPWNLVNLLDDIVVIACGLANLSPPILSDDKYL